MDSGDILNMLFLDEAGTPVTITLNSVTADGVDNRELPPDAPVALTASDVTATTFSANVSLMENTLGFYLDVATDSAFTAFVAGYSNLDIGLVDTYPVIGLDDATTYYYRFRGYNDYGTGESSNTITTLTDIETVVDGDGNVYTYVTIGTQQWLVENLKTTKYIDGAAIPNLTVNGDWIADITGAYCWYDNDIANKADYGALYNWYAVDNAHGLAPTGWRVPAQADFDTLVAYTGGLTLAGGVLKETGLAHWLTPNTSATDDYGFAALGAGQRLDTGSFDDATESCLFWQQAFARQLLYNSAAISEIDPSYTYGYSVRCMRDVV